LRSSSPTAQPPDPHVPLPCGAAAGVATRIHDAGTSRHATSLTGGEIAEQSDLGAITRITADNFPTLDRGWPPVLRELRRSAQVFRRRAEPDPLIVTRVNPVDEHAMGEVS
jgi:hypothetical protein